MPLGKLWAGHVFGTNTGNVFVDLEGGDESLTGVLRFSDSAGGIAVYRLHGSFDGSELNLEGSYETASDGSELAAIKLNAQLTPKGELAGKWEAGNGAGGVFRLYPHDQTKDQLQGGQDALPQLYTARYEFDAIEIDRDRIVALAEFIQKDFPQSNVIITTFTGTEQVRVLDAFRTHLFSQPKSGMLKVYVQQPDSGLINRIAVVEFGQSTNLVITQGSDEAWVLGMLEKIKSNLQNLERHYATNIKRWGVGVNQLIFLGIIAYVPSLPSIIARGILLGSGIILILGINFLHVKYLPHATIHLQSKPNGFWARATPQAISWLISATAGVAATLIASYLQNLSLP